MTSFAPSSSPQRSAFYILLLGISQGFASTCLISSLYPRLPFALCRRRHFFCWPSLRPNELVSCRLFRQLSPLWVWMPVSLTYHSLLPSRSRSHVPSLAPSWLSPCPTLWLVLMPTCALRIYLDRTRSLSPLRQPFCVASSPFLRYVQECCFVLSARSNSCRWGVKA